MVSSEVPQQEVAGKEITESIKKHRDTEIQRELSMID